MYILHARTVHVRLRGSVSDTSHARSRLVSVAEFLIIVGSVLVLSLSVVIVCVGVVKLCKRYETNQRCHIHMYMCTSMSVYRIQCILNTIIQTYKYPML